MAHAIILGAMADSPRNETIRSFRNSPDDFLAEALGGFVAAHPDAEWNEAGFIGRSSAIVTDSGSPAVAVISGGGSGHEPMHAGFIGAGMLAAACPGHMFTSPNAVQVTEATRWADQGAGVLHIVKNYTGDVMNFQVARQSLPDVETRAVVVADDVATDIDSGSDGPGRRGTGATILVEKVAGAAAARGDSLDAVTEIATFVAENSRSMAVALAPGHLPTSGRDTFDLPEGQMEVGVGIHGERGVSRETLADAGSLCGRLVEEVTEALGAKSGEDFVCLVNGLGGTTNLELNLVFGQVLRELGQRGIHVRHSLVGSFVTSVNMAGVSLTLTRATDKVVELLDADTDAPAWPRVLGGEAEFAPARIAFDDSLSSEQEMKGGSENVWLSDFVERVQGATNDLTELDRLAGDGDFGANMDAAFGEIELPLHGSDATVLAALSHRMLVRAGGTSGAVFGTLFRELGEAAQSITDALGSGLSATAFAAGLEKAVSAVMDLGGASEGDNTLVDALAPAARAAREAASDDRSFDEVLTASYEAARDGALATTEMVATKGRASYLGDASKGVPDPGAIVVAWLFGGSGRTADFAG